MVFKFRSRILGFNFEFSTTGLGDFVELTRDRSGCCSPLVVPVAVTCILFLFTMQIASLVFGIQALVVGTATFQATPCANTIGVWLIVYGTLSIANCALSFLCGGKGDDGDERSGCLLGTFINLVSLVTFGWLCYGMYLVYTPGTLKACNPSQFQVFELMTLFMFYGSVAALVGSLFLLCAMGILSF